MNYRLFFKEKHIKATKGRILILDILTKSNEAISADKIFEICKENGNSIDLSTVYRCLELFSEKGIIDKFDLGKGKYNYKLKEHGHKHMIQCSICSKKVEIDCPMLQVEELIKEKTGFVLLEHELKMKAICQECSNKKEKK
jgi:Fur family ferric uptake transcriptional regulator